MIMALNLVIVRNLQMVMDPPVINIIHIIIITMATMIVPQRVVDMVTVHQKFLDLRPYHLVI